MFIGRDICKFGTRPALHEPSYQPFARVWLLICSIIMIRTKTTQLDCEDKSLNFNQSQQVLRCLFKVIKNFVCGIGLAKRCSGPRSFCWLNYLCRARKNRFPNGYVPTQLLSLIVFQYPVRSFCKTNTEQNLILVLYLFRRFGYCSNSALGAIHQSYQAFSSVFKNS